MAADNPFELTWAPRVFEVSTTEPWPKFRIRGGGGGHFLRELKKAVLGNSFFEPNHADILRFNDFEIRKCLRPEADSADIHAAATMVSVTPHDVRCARTSPPMLT